MLSGKLIQLQYIVLQCTCERNCLKLQSAHKTTYFCATKHPSTYYKEYNIFEVRVRAGKTCNN